MIKILLGALLFSTPTHQPQKPLSPRQVRMHAHNVAVQLRKLRPQVLRAVMYEMKWVPKMEYKRQNCKKNNKDSLKEKNEWEMNMLLDLSGIPRKKR